LRFFNFRESAILNARIIKIKMTNPITKIVMGNNPERRSMLGFVDNIFTDITDG